MGNDPVNFIDPTGTDSICGPGRHHVYVKPPTGTTSSDEIVVVGYKCIPDADVTPLTTGDMEGVRQYLRELQGAQNTTTPQKVDPKPTEKMSIGCGVLSGGIGCKRVTYKELCAGASKRRKALTGTVAADTAIVGASGVIKQLAKGAVARLVAAEIAADVLDERMYCG